MISIRSSTRDITSEALQTADGKSILVTGAGTGIGRGIAEQFALAGAARIVIAARRTAPLEDTRESIELLAPSCQVIVKGHTDVADVEAVRRLFNSLEDLPDVLVHNAAVSLATATVEDSDPSTWLSEVDINIHGMYNMAHTYINALKAAGKTTGRIINISSNGSWRYVNGRSSYTMAKLAMNSFTEYVDQEQQDIGTNIRCVAMDPGGMKTTLSRTLPEHILKNLNDTPELSGATAVYLSTGRANFVMGRFISAIWDLEELERLQDRVVEDDLLRGKVVGCDWRIVSR